MNYSVVLLNTQCNQKCCDLPRDFREKTYRERGVDFDPLCPPCWMLNGLESR